MTRHILLTGLPGVGKTTVIKYLVDSLAPYHPDGFFTQEIREDGIRKGFELVTLDGRRQLLSHVNIPGPHRVGRYGVDLAGFENLLETLDLRQSPSRVVMLDEIGKMECLSPRFIQEVEALLDSSKMVIASGKLQDRTGKWSPGACASGGEAAQAPHSRGFGRSGHGGAHAL